MKEDKQIGIKRGRVGAVAAFAAAVVVSYLVVVSLLVREGGQSPIETLGMVLDRFLRGNYSSSTDTKLKADKSANNPKSAPGAGTRRARPGRSREVLRQPEPLRESNRGPQVQSPSQRLPRLRWRRYAGRSRICRVSVPNGLRTTLTLTLRASSEPQDRSRLARMSRIRRGCATRSMRGARAVNRSRVGTSGRCRRRHTLP
jgi:hypothetical protein